MGGAFGSLIYISGGFVPNIASSSLEDIFCARFSYICDGPSDRECLLISVSEKLNAPGVDAMRRNEAKAPLDVFIV
jgi:hypothetical protein